MKKVNADWELRNLNVKTIEVVIEKDDSSVYVQQQLSEIDGDYVVVKVSSDINGMINIIQNCGYKYIEDLIHVEHDLREVTRSRVLQRLYDETTYRRMNDDDINQLFDEVDDGMFDSDRISNDPMFGKDFAARRYSNWLRNLLNKGASFYVIRYRNDSTGFVVLETADGINYHSVLGGGYRKYRSSGMGIIQKEQEITRALGGRRVLTSVSSNNVKQLKALIVNGYVPYSIDHIFVKHILQHEEAGT